MYYRRKIILGLLETFGGKIDKIAFQKLLMILSKSQDKPAYEFVPYKFGGVSFRAYADIRTMIKYEQIIEDESTQKGNKPAWIKSDKDDYFPLLKKNDQLLLNYIKDKFNNYSTDDLILYTYRKYPFYAINSTIAEKVLTPKELKKVNDAKPHSTKKALYTIGYEGISQEHYLNKLIKNDIKILCDVRKNPLSMKYGFSKNQLKNACSSLEIDYIHLPKLGIDGKKRKNLINQCDYERLFEEYNQSLNSEDASEAIKELILLLNQHQRVAITCFEANIHQCHRKHLANKVNIKNKKFEVIHI